MNKGASGKAAEPWRKWYKQRHWLARREAQLLKEPFCKYCLRLNPPRHTIATVADHIRPHRGEWTLFLGPLQSMCKEHHDGEKHSEEMHGYSKAVDEHGFPVDPKHPASL